jgi:hypothetical protein
MGAAMMRVFLVLCACTLAMATVVLNDAVTELFKKLSRCLRY